MTPQEAVSATRSAARAYIAASREHAQMLMLHSRGFAPFVAVSDAQVRKQEAQAAFEARLDDLAPLVPRFQPDLWRNVVIARVNRAERLELGRWRVAG